MKVLLFNINSLLTFKKLNEIKRKIQIKALKALKD
jgi:hypothetical protein